MKRKKIIQLALTVFLATFFQTTFCQKTLNVSSHSATINGLVFDYSIGEMSLITTEKNSSLTITQGFLQPANSGSDAPTPALNNSASLSDLIKVYPNPTENILFVETNETIDGTLNYQLFDATGKVVLSNTINQEAGPNKFTMELKSLAAGTYYLMLRKANTDSTPENYSYKIQKIN